MTLRPRAHTLGCLFALLMATPAAADPWTVEHAKLLTREHTHLINAGGDVEGVIVLPGHDVSPGQQIALILAWKRTGLRLRHVPPAVVTQYVYRGRDAAGVTLQRQQWTLWDEDARTLRHSIGANILSGDPICAGWVSALIGSDETAKTEDFRYPIPTEIRLSGWELLGLDAVMLQIEPAPAGTVRIVYPQ